MQVFFTSFIQFCWNFEQFLDFKKAPGALKLSKGAFEHAQLISTYTKAPKAPQIPHTPVPHERRLTFAKIIIFAFSKSEKGQKLRFLSISKAPEGAGDCNDTLRSSRQLRNDPQSL